MTEQPSISSMNERATIVSIDSAHADDVGCEDSLLAELNALIESVTGAQPTKGLPYKSAEDEVNDRLLAELMAIDVPKTSPDVHPMVQYPDPEEPDLKASEPTAWDRTVWPAARTGFEATRTDNVVPLVAVAPVSSNTTTDQVAPTMPLPSDMIPSMPKGFALFGDGIYQLPDSEPVFVCTPFRVDATFADQRGAGAGKLISVQNGDGDWREIAILNADLMRRPTEVIAKLTDLGLELAADKKSKDSFLGLLTSWRPMQRLRSVKTMGWFDDEFKSFTLGNTAFGRSDILPLAPATGIGNGLVSRGQTEDWKANVGSLCQNNPLMILAVSLAFSGPLLAPFELHGGGLHFRGASSSGKTTLLRLAASVWGDRKLITQWRATSNGLEAIAATLNDMMLPLDEIAEIPARVLHEAIYMLANGTGKARMTKDVVLADQARWRLALISSGEVSVEDKLREARLDAMAGHEVRLIDIEADARSYGVFDNLHGEHSAAAFADRVQHAVHEYHGAVGHAFINQLIKLDATKLSALRAEMSDLARAWTSELPSAPDGQISRVATRFATISVAGCLATSMGLTGWSAHEARDAAKQAFFDWYLCRYGSKRDAADDYAKPLQAFIGADLSNLNAVAAVQPGAHEPLGWRDATHAYLPVQTWSSIFGGVDASKAAKALAAMQLLKTGEDGRMTCRAPRALQLSGRPRLYVVNLDRVAAYKPD